MTKRLEKPEEKYTRHTSAIAEASDRRHGLYNSIQDRADDAAEAVAQSGGIDPVYVDDADRDTNANGTRYDRNGERLWQSNGDADEGHAAVMRAAAAQADADARAQLRAAQAAVARATAPAPAAPSSAPAPTTPAAS